MWITVFCKDVVSAVLLIIIRLIFSTTIHSTSWIQRYLQNQIGWSGWTLPCFGCLHAISLPYSLFLLPMNLSWCVQKHTEFSYVWDAGRHKVSFLQSLVYHRLINAPLLPLAVSFHFWVCLSIISLLFLLYSNM